MLTANPFLPQPCPQYQIETSCACSIEGLRAEASDSAAERARLTEDLAEARERVRAEEAAQRAAAERQEASSRELEIMRVELTASRQNVEKAEFDKAKVRLASTRHAMHCMKAWSEMPRCCAALRAA